MKHLIYFVLMVILWISFIPAFNSLVTAPSELRVWFVVINVVMTTKLLIDLHTTNELRGARGKPGATGATGATGPKGDRG